MARNLAERNIAARRQASENITSAADAYRSMGQQHLENLGQVRSQHEALRQRREDRKAREQDAEQKELQRTHLSAENQLQRDFEAAQNDKDRELAIDSYMLQAEANIKEQGGTTLDVALEQQRVAHEYGTVEQQQRADDAVRLARVRAEEDRKTATHEFDLTKGILKYETVLKKGLDANNAELALTQMREQFKLARTNDQQAAAQKQLHEIQLLKLEMMRDSELRIKLLKLELANRTAQAHLDRESRENIADAEIAARAGEAETKLGIDEAYGAANIIMKTALGDNFPQLYQYDPVTETTLPTYVTDDSLNFQKWRDNYKRLVNEDRLGTVIDEYILAGSLTEEQGQAMRGLVLSMADIQAPPAASRVVVTRDDQGGGADGQNSSFPESDATGIFSGAVAALTSTPAERLQDQGAKPFIAGGEDGEWRFFDDSFGSGNANLQDNWKETLESMSGSFGHNISAEERPVLDALVETLQAIADGNMDSRPRDNQMIKMGRWLREMHAADDTYADPGAIERGLVDIRRKMGLVNEENFQSVLADLIGEGAMRRIVGLE